MAKTTAHWLRVEKVYHLLLKGKSRQKIIKAVQEEEDISITQIDKCIMKAKADIVRLGEAKKEEVLNLQLQRYESLYEQARHDEKLKEAIIALQQIDKLQNLSIQKIDLTSDGKAFEVKINFISDNKNENLDSK